jgi:hypothetical protein
MRVSTSLRNASLVLVLLSTFAAWLSGRNLAAQNPSSDTSAKLAADLQSRAKQYLDFRKRVAGNAPRPTATPAKITAVQRQLADKVRVARAGAKQGEVFTPEITEYVRRQIAASLDGRDGNHIRASLRHAEPVSITLQINQSYPDNVPLQSTPPSLLLSLPELPAGLEYRLVGRELVLRDVDANIVVDYVANALPDRK